MPNNSVWDWEFAKPLLGLAHEYAMWQSPKG